MKNKDELQPYVAARTMRSKQSCSTSLGTESDPPYVTRIGIPPCDSICTLSVRWMPDEVDARLAFYAVVVHALEGLGSCGKYHGYEPADQDDPRDQEDPHEGPASCPRGLVVV